MTTIGKWLSYGIEVRDPIEHYIDGSNFYTDWCKKHCQGKYNVIKYRSNTVCVYFEHEEERTLFCLVFGPALQLGVDGGLYSS